LIGFADESYINVSSGKGGDGCVSFRREKYVPKGGPDGGHGGKGGDVVFLVAPNLKTLSHLKLKRVFKAEKGEQGKGARKNGRDGRDVEIPVPPGTILKDAQTGSIIKDLTGLERWVFLKGGRGGKGNSHFATAVRQTPRFAQPGEPGVELRICVELNLIADVGLVGFPNAGKSTLLSVLTNARPKIADYPFTTKTPNLGVMTYGDKELILADIPGILEGASRGAGMGIKFLKHISRTSLLLFCIDLSQENIEETFAILSKELQQFLPELMDKPRIILGTKLDLPEAEERFNTLKERFPKENVLTISAVTSRGILELKQALIQRVF